MPKYTMTDHRKYELSEEQIVKVRRMSKTMRLPEIMKELGITKYSKAVKTAWLRDYAIRVNF